MKESAKANNPQTWNRYSYTLNNPLNFVDPTGLKPDDYYTARDGTIQVFETDDSFDRFYVETTDTPGKYQKVAQLDKNEAGLVEFPASMDFFDRYGTVDAGGTDKKTGETVGQGDHFVQPVVAAALFGLAAVLKDSHGITMSFGDMSSSNGSDPWQPGQIHHSGHGHNGNRSGLDVDFRYVNKDGVSFQSQTATSDSQFSKEKNQTIYDTARKFGFTTNYQGTKGTLTGVTKVAGHNDHGHLGFNRGSANVILYRAEVLQNGVRVYRRVP